MDWLALVILLQQQPATCVDRDDRIFLAQMVNMLVLDDAPEPTSWQKRWILAIKKECKV
jgi:hypothetical protein